MSPLQPTNREADDQISFDIDFAESLALFDSVSGSGASSSQSSGNSALPADSTPTTKLTGGTVGISEKGGTSSLSTEAYRTSLSASPRQSATTFVNPADNRSIYGFGRPSSDPSTPLKISTSNDSTKKDRHLSKSSSVPPSIASSPLPASTKHSLGSTVSKPVKSTLPLPTSSILPEKVSKVTVKVKEKKNIEQKGEIDYQSKVLTIFSTMILSGIFLGFGGWSVYEISLATNIPFWEKTFREEIDICKDFLGQNFPMIYRSNNSNNKSEKKETQQDGMSHK